ncbi:MAG: iron ABC transporter permease [Pseudomonadota bacterium]
MPLAPTHIWQRVRAGDPLPGLVLFALATIAALSVLPMATLFARALSDLDQGWASALGQVLSDGATWTALKNSLVTCGFGTALAILLGAGFAFLVTLTDVRAKAVLIFLFMLPMIIPPQVTALSWLQLTGPSSALLRAIGMAPGLGARNPLYSAEGITLLLGVQHAPMVFLALRATLVALPREAVEAARLSGAGRGRVWRDIVLPLSMPGLIAGGAVAFVSALGNFGIPAFLGIPANYYVLPTLVYQAMANFGTRVIADVAALSLVISVVVVAAILVQQALARRHDHRLVGLASAPLAFALGRARPLTELALWSVLVVILVLPLLALVAASLVPTFGVRLTTDTASIAAYAEVLLRQAATIRAIGNSLLLAGAAAILLIGIALPIAYLAARSRARGMRAVLALIDLPYALPGVVLGVACILLFLRPLPGLGVSIYGTAWIILFAYLAAFLSVAFKPIESGLAQLDPALEEAAQSAGAGFARRMRDIVLPTLAPAAAASAILVFLIAVNELTVSALLWSGGNETIGVMIFNLNDGGENAMASALSVVVVGLVLVLMTLLELMGRHLPRGAVPWRS